MASFLSRNFVATSATAVSKIATKAAFSVVWVVTLASEASYFVLAVSSNPYVTPVAAIAASFVSKRPESSVAPAEIAAIASVLLVSSTYQAA